MGGTHCARRAVLTEGCLLWVDAAQEQARVTPVAKVHQVAVVLVDTYVLPRAPMSKFSLTTFPVQLRFPTRSASTVFLRSASFIPKSVSHEKHSTHNEATKGALDDECCRSLPFHLREGMLFTRTFATIRHSDPTEPHLRGLSQRTQNSLSCPTTFEEGLSPCAGHTGAGQQGFGRLSSISASISPSKGS